MIELDSEIIMSVNRCFNILKHFIAESTTEITTSLIGSDLVDAINDNFHLFDAEAPSVVKEVYIGMTGSAFLSYLNDNFDAKNTSLDSSLADCLLRNQGSIIGWFDAFDLTTITKDESDIVSKWEDKLGSGNDLSGECSWSADNGMIFNGVDQYLQSGYLESAIRPFSVYLFWRNKSWTLKNIVFDGFIQECCLKSVSLPGSFRIESGNVSDINTSITSQTWNITRVVFNGANSKFKIDDNVIVVDGEGQGPITGDFGSYDPYGFTIGADKELSVFSDIEVQGIILLNSVLSDEDEELFNSYLKSEYMAKYRFDTGKLLIHWDGDIMPDILTGHNILVANNCVKDTLFVCGRGGGGTDDEAMWNIITTMKNNGTDIQAHGYDHIKLTTLDEDGLNANFTSMNNAITGAGFDTPLHIAYPFGAASPLVVQVASEYYLSGRGITVRQLCSKVTNKFALPTFHIVSQTNNEECITILKEQIDYAVANKTVMTLYGHGVKDGVFDIANFTDLIQYAKASGITFINTSELYALLT